MIYVRCYCGKSVSVTKILQRKDGDTEVIISPCDDCVLKAYQVGYVDGGGTLPGTAKTTAAAIIAATRSTTGVAGIGVI